MAITGRAPVIVRARFTYSDNRTPDRVTFHAARRPDQTLMVHAYTAHAQWGAWKAERYNGGHLGRDWVRAFVADNLPTGTAITF